MSSFNLFFLRQRLFGMLAVASIASRLGQARYTTAAFTSSRILKRPSISSQRFPWILSGVGGNNDGGDTKPGTDIKPTWTYVPYDPKKPKPQRRNFSSWNVPKKVNIREDQLEISFVRASGAGGQNVNKVNTKVEIRLHIPSASWIPFEVRERLKTREANRINKEGYLTLTSQEYRTQGQNRKAVVSKLEQLLLQAWPRPKVRKQRKGVSRAAKERNKQFKKKRSEIKKSRGKVDW